MASEIKITAAGETMVWVTSQADTSANIVSTTPAVRRDVFLSGEHFASVQLADSGGQITLWGADVVTVERNS